MTRNEFEDDYCKYYFALEEDFEKTLRYVEVHADNFDTYSFEYLRQIQVICAEFDSLSKEICGIPQTERKNITDYYAGLIAKYPDIYNKEVSINKTKIKCKPFEAWNAGNYQALEWWEAYNGVKHGRASNLKYASLKNVLNALGALYVLNMIYLKELADVNNETDVPYRKSEIFSLIGHNTRNVCIGDGLIFGD